MIKVIQIITDTNIGGAGIWLLNYLKYYNRNEFDMSVILPEKSQLQAKVEELGVKCIIVENIADKSFSIGGISSLFKALKKESPDIIHTHASLSARIAAKLLGIRVIHTRHCLEDKKSFLKEKLYSFVNNSLSCKVIGVSQAVCENLLNEGIKKDKIKCVYNGITPLKEISDERKRNIRESYGIPEGKITVGMVARLEKVKNHEMFIHAAKKISDMRSQVVFLIVGTGSREEELKKIALDIKADNVIFTGHIDDVNDIMNVIDIHALTSEKEALSISLIEGMSLAKPVVATNSGGPCELVKENRNGIIVDVNDVDAFVDALLKYIDDPMLRNNAGMMGKEIAYRDFSAENMAKYIEKIYEEALGKGGNKQ